MFWTQIIQVLAQENIVTNQLQQFFEIVLYRVSNNYAPIKKKYFRANQGTFMKKTLQKKLSQDRDFEIGF